MLFRACNFTFEFPRPTLVMGIVNVTPDSFSDGGQFLDTGKAIAHALKLVEEGAEILDIGGESTRPGARPVSEAEELSRAVPVIEQLASLTNVPLSIDTVKPAVAKAALTVGASIVNDVAANRSDDTMWRIVAESGAGYICMHMQGTPPSMQANPRYQNVTREVGDFFDERLARLSASGVHTEQVALDPGIGFGKTLEHNLQLLAHLGTFSKFARPLAVGVSRKSFIGQIAKSETTDRLPGSLAASCLAIEAGASIIRAHDVAETVKAARVAEAIAKARH